MTDKPAEFLTVQRLIEDLSQFDSNIEVAIVMEKGGITMPIVNLLKLVADERTVALLVTPVKAVKIAMDLYDKSIETVN